MVTERSLVVTDRKADRSGCRNGWRRQPRRITAAAKHALLRTFHDPLTDLTGEPLTGRLLRTAFDHPSSGDAAQDTLP
jgi:hypothetical protein